MPRTGRPKTGKVAISGTLRVSPESWESLRKLAESLGMTRSELVERIADKKIPLALENSQAVESMGKSFAS
ncbi:ribbon-helix-helix protein, CopG family [Fortiea contorta]|uniref:ribbon-helix-helix protein, CopG family n=1 Tax=Fortiea contorta TaxID=1892405 RepID=UPI00058B9504